MMRGAVRPVLASLLLALPAAAELPPDAARAIQADVARLASTEWQGRRAGTDGADRAADWIAGRFREAGLDAAGDGGSFFQEFSFISGAVLGAGNRVEASGRKAWKAGRDFRPAAFSLSGAAEGEVVFVGYGIVAPDLGRDDYAGIEVSGRIALALRYGPEGSDTQSKWGAFMALRYKALTAREKGARALLVVSGPLTRGAADDLVPFRADVSLQDAGLPVVSIRRKVADAILAPHGSSLEAVQRRLDSAGRPASFPVDGSRVSLAAEVVAQRAATRNVVGVVPGRGPEAIVVGAHYDHLGLGATGSLDPKPEGKVHHGADDNASGTAALIGLARAIAPRRAELARSVYFVAFGAEELGTLGSSHFVKAPPVPLERIAAMVNMDMVGRLRDSTLELHGVGSSPVWKGLIEEANGAAGLKLRIVEGGYGPSDHNPFYAAGRPVLFAFTGAHADYHRPSDTADKIDAVGIARVLGLIEPTVALLARSTEPVPFVRVAAEASPPASAARGLRAWVGGIPDYAEQGPGVRFSGVQPGSPAEKAGVRTGDVLVRFGTTEIRNIYDYTYALGAAKPGDQVRAVVRRGDALVPLEITLGTRPAEAR
jgi:hypothetical protein